MLAFDGSDTLFTAERGIVGGAELQTIELVGPVPLVGTVSAVTAVSPFGLTGVPGLTALAFGSFNSAPDCSLASASLAELWPPNHAWTPVTVSVTDPDGDFVMVTIDAIWQDEAINGRGDGNTAPDADGVGTSVAMLRAERSGRENGRVYEIDFTADDGVGGSCSGTGWRAARSGKEERPGDQRWGHDRLHGAVASALFAIASA